MCWQRWQSKASSSFLRHCRDGKVAHHFKQTAPSHQKHMVSQQTRTLRHQGQVATDAARRVRR